MKTFFTRAQNNSANGRNLGAQAPEPQTVHRGKLRLAVVVGITVFGLCGSYVAQQFQGLGNSADIIWGWDFSGMSAEEKSAGLQVLFPVEFNDALSKTKDPVQIDFEAQAVFAITNPAAYAAQRSVNKAPAQLAAEATAAYAIANPVSHQSEVDRQKTAAELQAEKFSAWAMTHPDEFNRSVEPLKTVDDIAAEALGIEEIAQPEIKPAPVYKGPPPVGDLPF